jgi:hypothetical protein
VQATCASLPWPWRLAEGSVLLWLMAWAVKRTSTLVSNWLPPKWRGQARKASSSLQHSNLITSTPIGGCRHRSWTFLQDLPALQKLKLQYNRRDEIVIEWSFSPCTLRNHIFFSSNSSDYLKPVQILLCLQCMASLNKRHDVHILITWFSPPITELQSGSAYGFLILVLVVPVGVQ